MEGYRILELLGMGSYGRVYRALRKVDGTNVAIKEVDYSRMSEKEKKMLVNEVNILKKLKCKYIVRYIDRFNDIYKKKMFIIMDYCPNGDLQKHIKQISSSNSRVPENEIWQALAELALALKECHCAKDTIIHRDIKPGNIFIDKDKNVKLGDFGLARPLVDGLARTCAGTPLYMSPEVNSGHPYDHKSDIWALGCVIYEMADLSPPFRGYSSENLSLKIRTTNPKRLHPSYSNELNYIICRMLEKDPKKRPSVVEVLDFPRVKLAIKLIELQEERDRIRFDTMLLKDRKDYLSNELTKIKIAEDRMVFRAENFAYN